ncbi:MAG: ATP-dependent DNA ligase [Candidatus Rokubacteria bacterium]|nr:ATP-dependent DNA ligase [Candidatus Rokubacteria bacterium]
METPNLRLPDLRHPGRSPEDAASLDAFAGVLSAVQATRARLEKRRILGDYIRALPDDALPLAVTYLSGRPFPRADKRRLSVGWAALEAALHRAWAGLPSGSLEAAWRRHADPSEVAGDLWAEAGRTEGERLSLAEVAEIFAGLAERRGASAKAALLAQAVARMSARGLRAFVKVLLAETRIGVQEGVLEDAVAHATGQPLEAIRAANRHRADLGAVALEARRGALAAPRFAYFTPIDPMLAHPVASAEDAVRRLGQPVWVEDKYDGVRCQLHKAGNEVRLFSRDRHDISGQFPDVTRAFAAGPRRFVLDGELMAAADGRLLPFARLQPRLNRVAPSAEILAAHPVALVAFDLLALEAEVLLDAPLTRRRAALDRVAFPAGHQRAPVASAASAAQIEVLFGAARARGNEGLMCKQPGSAYVSGRRGYQWLKVKRPLETLEVVVVGAEWGHGKRRGMLSDLTFAVRDTSDGTLRTIGKAYNGLTDAEIRAMTERLLASTVATRGGYRAVRPEIVLEVAFNHIQKSARHDSGYALRFPRIVRVREDRSPAEASTLADAARLHATLFPLPLEGGEGQGEGGAP